MMAMRYVSFPPKLNSKHASQGFALVALLVSLPLILGHPARSAWLVLAISGAILLVATHPKTLVGVLMFSFLLAPEQPVFLTVFNYGVDPRNLILLLTACMALLWTWRGYLRGVQLAAGRWWIVWGAAVMLGCAASHSLKPIPLFLVTYVLPYTLGCTLGQRAELRERAAKTLGWATLVVAALAISEFATSRYLFPATPMELMTLSRIGVNRVRVDFGHPLALGMFLTLGLFFAVRLFDSVVARLSAAGLVVIATAMTVSRAPLVGLAAAALSYAVLATGTRKRVKGLATVAVMALVLFFAPGSFAQDFKDYLSASTQQSNEAAGNVIGRQQLLIVGLDVIARSPLTGSGLGSTFRGNSTIVTEGGQTFGDIANFPLDIAVETGVAGLFALLMIVITSLRRGGKTEPNIRRTLIASVIGASVTSLGVTALSVAGITLFVLGIYSATPEA